MSCEHTSLFSLTPVPPLIPWSSVSPPPPLLPPLSPDPSVTNHLLSAFLYSLSSPDPRSYFPSLPSSPNPPSHQPLCLPFPPLSLPLLMTWRVRSKRATAA